MDGPPRWPRSNLQKRNPRCVGMRARIPEEEYCRFSLPDCVLRSAIIASQCWRVQHSVLKKRKKRVNAVTGCFPTRSAPVLHLCHYQQARRASRCGKGRRTCTEQGPDVTLFGVIFLPFPVCYGYIFDIRRIDGMDMDMIRDAQPRRTSGESALLIRIDPLAPSSHNRRACAGMAILSRLSIVAAPCCPGAARKRRRVS